MLFGGLWLISVSLLTFFSQDKKTNKKTWLFPFSLPYSTYHFRDKLLGGKDCVFPLAIQLEGTHSVKDIITELTSLTLKSRLGYQYSPFPLVSTILPQSTENSLQLLCLLRWKGTSSTRLRSTLVSLNWINSQIFHNCQTNSLIHQQGQPLKNI